MSAELINGTYIIAAVLFIFGLKQMSSPATAVRGNLLSAVGMLLAILVTLVSREIVEYQWIGVAVVLGAIVGCRSGSESGHDLHAGDGGAVQRLRRCGQPVRRLGSALYNTGNTTFTIVTILLSILIGGMTFSGSIIAWGKLSEVMTSRAIVFGAQRVVNALLLVALVYCGVMFAHGSGAELALSSTR